jgi:uncharacterized protein YxeA
MKKVIVLIVALIFAFSVIAIAAEAPKKADTAITKCEKCHKGEKALDKVTAAKKITTADGMIKGIAANEKGKKMHAKFTDDDYKAVAKELKLK